MVKHALRSSNLPCRNTPGFRSGLDQHLAYRSARCAQEVLTRGTDAHTATCHLHTHCICQIEHEAIDGGDNSVREINTLKQIPTANSHIGVFSVRWRFFKAHQVPISIELFGQHLSQCSLCALPHL